MRKLMFIGLIILLQTACQKEDKSFSGYVDTDLVYLSADFGGRLTDLAVLRGQLVTSNQFLFHLEQTSELYHVEMSQLNSKSLLAQRQQIMIQQHYNEINYRRIVDMRKQNAASQNDLDAAQRDLNVSKQQLADIDFKLKSSHIDTADNKWRVTRKENFAPERGIIFDTYYTKGEFVQAGYPILSLITQNNIKAIFFVPEKKLNQLRINAPVNIRTNQNANFATGHIFYISNIAEYTPPIIYSREERERLVFRVEARIDAPDLEKIHLGQPVTLELA
ncbi:HlyD family secretion protein [Legionella maioricensis]|uniref:HlyD family efflux transporter periplasmic adaptor subunit n=1 Tax=Legionella maioricensis TaxID=2896528 RepID=A0A9X2D336_9GAMM|nr:HlyD family efflux transporter periplasmic adaptor subunit [Legionella maioricensis]MCL9685439.1 HlyD family efflux transporter periplasmic adaptor subunit [Legionella maioricensis]MCL9688741.1 HlyD family efflux transporter periplasmic adaptor subunit [Legionella maioricensis]